MTKEEAQQRFRDLHAATQIHGPAVIAMMEQIEMMFPGTRLTLVVRDPAVPYDLGFVGTVMSRDNVHVVGAGLLGVIGHVEGGVAVRVDIKPQESKYPVLSADEAAKQKGRS